MVVKKQGFSKTKIWFVFVVLFICGAMVGFGIANFGWYVKNNSGDVVEHQSDENLSSCQALENVLLHRLHNNDDNCDWVKYDLDVYRKLATYGCDENHDKYLHEIDNKNAILNIACEGYVFNDTYRDANTDVRQCEQIEQVLYYRMPDNDAGQSVSGRIDRAKIYAVMAEKGCPENSGKYADLARQELEIARAIRDDEFSDNETIEVVETYKRLKMQSDAQEIFDKVKKLTNPAIDFIMQVEKIINE